MSTSAGSTSSASSTGRAPRSRSATTPDRPACSALRLSHQRRLEANAAWSEQADVTTNVTGASLTEIFKEVARLRSEPPPTDELRGIQSYLAGVFVLRNSSRQGIIRQLAFVEIQGLTNDYLRSFTQRVWAVTPADVQRIASTYLDPKKMTIVVAGDRQQVDSQLAPWTNKPGK